VFHPYTDEWDGLGDEIGLQRTRSEEDLEELSPKEVMAVVVLPAWGSVVPKAHKAENAKNMAIDDFKLVAGKVISTYTRYLFVFPPLAPIMGQVFDPWTVSATEELTNLIPPSTNLSSSTSTSTSQAQAPVTVSILDMRAKQVLDAQGFSDQEGEGVVTIMNGVKYYNLLTDEDGTITTIGARRVLVEIINQVKGALKKTLLPVCLQCGLFCPPNKCATPSERIEEVVNTPHFEEELSVGGDSTKVLFEPRDSTKVLFFEPNT
jgi:hypothetical protein